MYAAWPHNQLIEFPSPILPHWNRLKAVLADHLTGVISIAVEKSTYSSIVCQILVSCNFYIW